MCCSFWLTSWWGISLWYHTAIAHCHGQLTVVIDMGYGNGVWSDQELTTGGACVRYAKVIKHNGEERGIPQTYTVRTKKWSRISGRVCTVKLFTKFFSLQAIETNKQYCILTVLDKFFWLFKKQSVFCLNEHTNTIQSLTSVNLPSKCVISKKSFHWSLCCSFYITTLLYFGDKKK